MVFVRGKIIFFPTHLALKKFINEFCFIFEFVFHLNNNIKRLLDLSEISYFIIAEVNGFF
jgi:hypothetical protein